MFGHIIGTAAFLFLGAFLIGTLISIFKAMKDRKRAADEHKSDETKTDGNTQLKEHEKEQKGGKT